MQVILRQECLECEGEDPNCAKCAGTGWEMFWFDLKWLARSIREGEPIEAAINLGKLAKRGG